MIFQRESEENFTRKIPGSTFLYISKMKFLNTSRILPEKEKPMYLQSLISF